MLHDADRFRSIEGPGPERMAPATPDGMLVYADPPAHTQQRRIAVRAFAPRRIDHLEAQIQRHADELIDARAGRGAMEVVEDFAIPLTVETIRRYFGIEESRRDDIRRWGDSTINVFGADDAEAAASLQVLNDEFSYLAELVATRAAMAQRGEELPDDVLTLLMISEYRDGAPMTAQEVVMASHVLLVGGYETTSMAIGNAVVSLASHREQLAALCTNWSLLPSAVEECLRFEPSIEEAFRTTSESVRIGDVPIPAGTKVRAVLTSANRDELLFSDPDMFRIDRAPAEVRRHLTFGVGRHACLGAALARMEMRIAIRTLFTRFPGLVLDPDHPPVRTTHLHSNGYTQIRVRW
jgi:hypothetical protein